MKGITYTQGEQSILVYNPSDLSELNEIAHSFDSAENPTKAFIKTPNGTKSFKIGDVLIQKDGKYNVLSPTSFNERYGSFTLSESVKETNIKFVTPKDEETFDGDKKDFYSLDESGHLPLPTEEGVKETKKGKNVKSKKA